MAEQIISHAFVLPDADFASWFQVLRPYASHFERVAIIRDPAGNDLNPYRDVSVVNALATWLNDDPLYHIRSIYPQVVRVDIVQARTPDELGPILQGRIAADDRFGEHTGEGAHIMDRFTLEYPTDHRPMRIVAPLTKPPTATDADNLGLRVATAPGSKILAGAAGTVTRQWSGDTDDELRLGKYVQITTQFGGIDYVVTYAGVGTIHVPITGLVEVGAPIADAVGDTVLIIVQQAKDGLPGYRLPNIMDPTPMIYVTNLRVKPTGGGLRVRTIPSIAGEVMGALQTYDRVFSKESHGVTLQKMGVEGQWLHIRLPDGRSAYTAAWFLEAIQRRPTTLTANPTGVNLDVLHHLGTPDPARLGRIGWVRFGYNVSNNSGSEDIRAAYDRYAPVLARYAEAGYKIVLATSHQTYGEGKDEFWPWPNMTDDKWNRLTARFSEMMGRISQQFAGKGLVHAWQVWNEQDAPIGAVASVPMLAHNYQHMLSQVVPAIRSADSEVYVTTGGHTAGPGRGAEYARQSLAGLAAAALPDGIAFHPYGRGPNIASKYANFGHIDESMSAYLSIMPDKPVWITEWGVLQQPNENALDIANYATDFITYLKATYHDQVACMIWYAWAESMHNGYGIVDANGQPREPLTSRYLQA